MGIISSWRGFYGVMAIAVVTVVLYYLFITRPLLVREHEVNWELNAAAERLAEQGLGTSRDAVASSLEQVREEIEKLSALSRDPRHMIQFEPEVEEKLFRSFLVLDFEERRYLVADRLAESADAIGVDLSEDIEAQLPTYRPDMEQPHILWAQLAVIEQLVLSAVRAGVGRIDSVHLIDAEPEEGEWRQEISLHMELTGPMEAVRSFVLSLPFNDEELRELEIDFASTERKSAFFINRFILRKASRERADEVTLELVASAFLDPRMAR